jgi:transcriptional enhancer factor
MGHSLNILPSNGQQLSLDSSALLQVRQPLSNTPGNAQPRTMASEDSCCETKHLAQADNPNYLIPASQLQPPVQQLETTFDRQRQSIRRRRQHKHSRNPIIHSPQYQDYRARQGRSGNHEDGKWPEILEIAFLDGNNLSFHSSFFILLTLSKPSLTYLRWAEESSPSRANPMGVTN